ncbi:unnamed protein product [Schistosoma bovis]|nr:unnamed protein product [Schistosoma bovis]
MKLFFISIIGIFSLLISQEYGYTVDINLNDAKQKQHLITKLNSLNQYLQSRGINKQFTEDEFHKIIYDRLNKHIEDEKSDVRIIEKEVSKRPVQKHVDNETSDSMHDKQPIQKEVSKRPVQKHVDNETSDSMHDKQPIQKEVSKRPVQKHVDNETSDRFHSISDIFIFNKPWIPLWIVNPLYYIAEKFMQIMAFLLVDDNIRELQMPEYYYDTSI